MKKRRDQAARRQRWTDASVMVRYVLSNILAYPDDSYLKSEFEDLCKRVDRRNRAKQSDEQIVLKAIRAGCETVDAIQHETGFTSELILNALDELMREGFVTCQNNSYRLAPR